MSSNIKVQRICRHCGNGFIAKTTSPYCSHKCSQRAYKARIKADKINTSNKETEITITRPIEELKAKEFLSVKEVSSLLGCSIRTAYRLIDDGKLKAVNLSERMTRVKRSDLNKLMS